MERKHMSNGTLATLSLIILSVIFVGLVGSVSIPAQAVISIVCFALAFAALTHIRVNSGDSGRRA